MSEISRRQFLIGGAAVTAGLLINPERVLSALQKPEANKQEAFRLELQHRVFPDQHIFGVRVSGDGKTLYTTGRDDDKLHYVMRFVDIRDPKKPVPYNTTVPFENVGASGNANAAQVEPSAPQHQTNNSSHIIELKNGVLVATDYYDDIHVIDISNGPEDAQWLRGLEMDVRELAASGTHLIASSTDYNSGGWNRDLKIVDMSDPRKLHVVGQLPLDVLEHPYLTVHDEANCVYLSTRGLLRVVDISDPQNPRLAKSLPIQGDFEQITITPNRSGLVMAGYGGLITLDINDPHNPVIIGHNSLAGRVGQIRDLVVFGDIAFFGTEGPQLTAMGIANMQEPIKLTSIGGLNNGSVHSLDATVLDNKGNTALWAGQNNAGAALYRFGPRIQSTLHLPFARK